MKKEVPFDKTYRARAVKRALRYVGVKENPPYSNRGPLIDQWCRRANGLVGYPWCAAFVCAMFGDVGFQITEPRRASVGFFEQWAAKLGYLVDRPRRGDLVCYRFDSDNWPDHIGLVVRVLALRWRGNRFVGWIKMVEGNTSAGNDADGGQVQIRYRWMNGRQKFVRIHGPFV